MDVDEKMVAVVSGVIQNQYKDQKLSERNCKRIARFAILSNKVRDEEWLENRVAFTKMKIKHNSRGPGKFKLFSKFQQEVFIKTHGEDAFSFMKKVLKDPAQVGPRWGDHFMLTAKAIGLEAVAAAEEPYTFVTGHAKWAEFQESSGKIYAEYRKQDLVKAGLDQEVSG